MKLTPLFKEFFESEKAGGIVLIICTVISLLVANVLFGEQYVNMWNSYAGGLSISHWINDGLMAIFFLLIGLELEREVYVGELSNIKNASLPVIAAIGGMVIPAAIFIFFNYGLPTQKGAGISMATDIAFAIGILSLLGNKVPASLKIFLTAIAVIDDLGAIMVIAIFYTKTFVLLNLGIAMGIFGLLLVLNRLKVHNIIPYLIGGAVMWYFMLHSGVHATITGVLVAFAIPFGDGGPKSPSYLLQHWLHKPVAFIILPLFALANTAIIISGGWTTHLLEPNSSGIIAGLSIGKPLGIVLFSFIALKFGIGSLPEGMNLKQVLGIGLLAGIGFTMSIFICTLAYDDAIVVTQSKIAILMASLISGILGFMILKQLLKNEIIEEL